MVSTREIAHADNKFATAVSIPVIALRSDLNQQDLLGSPLAQDVPLGFATPKLFAQSAGRAGFPSNACTPVAAKRNLTSPSPFFGAKASERSNREEIESAVQEGSAILLSIALVHGHQCCRSHAVHEAVKRRHLRALDMLLSHGAPEFDEPCVGLRPLDLALQMSHVPGDTGYQMAERLLRHGARPNFCPDDSQHAASAPLHEAIARGNASMVRLLLAHGADANAPDIFGQAALHIVVAHLPVCMGDHRVHKAMVGALLQHGADPFQRDAAGRVPQQCTLDAGLAGAVLDVQKQWGSSQWICALKSHKRGEEFACVEMPEVFALLRAFL